MIEVIHGTRTTYNAGCRCDECRAAVSDYHAIRRAERRGKCPDDAHGTWPAYNSYGCRCDECSAAARTENRRQYESRLARGPRPGTHGRANTYVQWGCRCDECREAAQDVRRSRKAARS